MQRIRILVVDDHEIVRRCICEMLAGGSDIEVVCDASDGYEAVRKAGEFQPDVVLLDMTMPVMSGEETFRKLRGIRPDIKVILSSGYNEAEAVRNFSGKGLAGFVQKPYTSARLAEAISSVLTR